MEINNRFYGQEKQIVDDPARMQPFYYTTIDGTSTTITAKDVSQAVAGDDETIKKIYVGLEVGSKVLIKSPD
ncbi:MAG: hypothetical protein ACOC4Y_00815, partial [bacterium]